MAGQQCRVAYVVSHPIQYQAPLLRRLAAAGVDLHVFFISDYSLHEHQDCGFGCDIRWDVDLVGGYQHSALASGQTHPPRFFTGAWVGLATRIWRREFDVVWIHGWFYWANIVALLVARVRGVQTLLRGEARLDSRRRDKWIWTLLYCLLLRLGSRYLYIGSENRRFYEYYGARPEQLFSMPYCVDNDFFQRRAKTLAHNLPALKTKWGLRDDRPVILFSGKFAPRKKPDCLLVAYAALVQKLRDAVRPYLLFVGDGELRGWLEQEAATRKLANVRFVGFRNQAELCEFYAMCDVFVLASEDEPWGLAVNEVMNFGKPVIVSDQVGCAVDLVNGYDSGLVVPAGDVRALSEALRILLDPAEGKRRGARALARIRDWNYDSDVRGLLQAMGAQA